MDALVLESDSGRPLEPVHPLSDGRETEAHTGRGVTHYRGAGRCSRRRVLTRDPTTLGQARPSPLDPPPAPRGRHPRVRPPATGALGDLLSHYRQSSTTPIPPRPAAGAAGDSIAWLAGNWRSRQRDARTLFLPGECAATITHTAECQLVRKILAHLGLPTVPPRLAPARSPPEPMLAW